MYTGTVERSGASDTERVARVLGRAFQNDPVMSWIFPDAADRDSQTRPASPTFGPADHAPAGLLSAVLQILEDQDRAGGQDPGHRLQLVEHQPAQGRIVGCAHQQDHVEVATDERHVAHLGNRA